MPRGGVVTHGGSSPRTPEYAAWAGMKGRCLNQTDASFARYGGRGITVCDEWRDSFEAFIAHVGPRPRADLTIDRIDNERGYEPGNVRWATRKQQANNRRKWTHCKRGHALTPDNVRTKPTGGRECLTCSVATSRASRAVRRKEQILTRAQALVLLLVLGRKREGQRTTSTIRGARAVATQVANKLVRLGMLRRVGRLFEITRKGRGTARKLEGRGWTLAWLIEEATRGSRQ